jgi:hypothetical protein
LFVTTTPLASALSLPVPDSVQQTRDLGSVTSVSWSYAFNAQSFDVTTDGSSPTAVHYFNQVVTYDVGSAPGGFWTATIGGTWLGNVFSVAPPPTRSYETSVKWNDSAWLNMTTTFTLGGGAYTSPFAWQVCNHVDYVASGTNYGATKECDRRYWGGNPTRLQHSMHFGNVTLAGQNVTGWSVTFTGAHVVDQTFTSQDLLVPTSNAPNWTFSVTSSASSIAGDLAHVTVDYLASTNANYAAIDAGNVKATCNGFDCLAIKAADAVFGVLDHVLALVFDKLSSGTTQGHDAAGRTADAVTNVIAIFIGIPTTLAALFFLHPGKSFIALSDYLLILGIVRYGSSPMADASVIWSTVAKFWLNVGKGVVSFAVWMWGLVERLFQALLDASPITLMIIGGIVLGSAIGALIVKLGGG